MAKKPHKLSKNGLRLKTDLTPTELLEICTLAAVESKGDLWNGRQKIEKTGSGNAGDAYLIKDALVRSKLLTFTAATSVKEARTTLDIDIDWFVTKQSKYLMIPVSAKKMVAHHTFMQFVNKVANTVQAADPKASITIRSGAVAA